jgi:hypothetical protein
VNRLAPVLALALAAGSLAACGGGSVGAPSTTTGMSNSEQIKAAYVEFFSSKTPLATRVSLLENGSKFEPLISALAKNPLAKDTSATVSSVTISNPIYATVVYTVHISGVAVPGLKNRTGTAVRRSGGPWQVGDASFCALVELQGSTPSACKS